jgi:hypothetical protein
MGFTGTSVAIVLGLLMCVFVMQMGEVRGALRINTHGIRLHHEWEKSVQEEDWKDWERSFFASDGDGDGHIRLNEVNSPSP